MDVVCERCKAEYEFDDALVSERGTTVKCTTCGHQFKIYRPSVGEGGRSWHLRRPDGTLIPFDSLAVLQKWILEGRVSKVDEISRPGEPWKSLGAIAELESFFVTGEMRAAPRPGTPSNRPPPPPPASHRPPTPPRGTPAAPRAPTPPPPSLRPPTPPRGTPAHRPNASDLHDRTATSGTPVLPPAPRLPTDAPRAAVSTVEGYALGDAAIGPPKAPTPPPAAPVRSMPPPSLPATPAAALDRAAAQPPLDDDEPLPPLVPASGGSRGMFVGLALGLAVTIALTGAAWQLGYLRSTATPPAPAAPATGGAEVTARLDAARRLGVRHTPRALEDAREELTRALALAPDDAATLAARAHVMALWGELLRQRADDLDARAPGGDAGASPESATLRRDANERVERARADLPRAEAGVAALRGEARAQAEAALADVARIAGDSPNAQRHLEAARAAGGAVDADLAAALVARDAGLAAQAADGLRAVVARAGDRARARLALARILAAQGDAAGARRELDAVLQAYPDHDDARSLTAALDRNEAPMRGAVAVAAPPPPDAPPAAHAPPTPAPTTGDTNPSPAVARRSDAPPTAGRSYEQLVDDGERLLRDRMEVTQARERFRAALAQRPDGCEAIVGLGDVELEGGNLSTAVSQYRRALQICPRAGDAYVGLGQAYTSMQQYQQAIDAYTRYLDVNPGGGHANMARRHIEQLRERVGAAPTPGN